LPCFWQSIQKDGKLIIR